MIYKVIVSMADEEIVSVQPWSDTNKDEIGFSKECKHDRYKGFSRIMSEEDLFLHLSKRLKPK